MTTLSYITVHRRLRRDRGYANTHTCVTCGQQADEWAYDHKDPAGLKDRRNGMAYSVNQAHYMPMCRSCHRLFDADASGRGQCGTTGGYHRHRRVDQPACDACKAAHNDYSRERRVPKSRKRKACFQGHPLDPENVYTTPDGRRQCRTCRRARRREYQKAIREGRHIPNGSPLVTITIRPLEDS